MTKTYCDGCGRRIRPEDNRAFKSGRMDFCSPDCPALNSRTKVKQ